MKTAEEYRLVTGGRPWMYMRQHSAQVWTQTVRMVIQNAKRFRAGSGHSHETQMTRNSTT